MASHYIMKFIWQRRAHRQSWSRSRWRSMVSWWSLMRLYIRQSSANNLMLELVLLLMSLKYNINIRGPKDRSLWYSWFDSSLTGTVTINNHSLRLTCQPMSYPVESAMSKALEKSSTTRSSCSWSSRHLAKSSMVFTCCVSQRCLFLKPCLLLKP